ncbi:zinc ribbon domain-containing protein [Burkholderia sp. Tr-862]|nr:zinc ribbon domain-containing protein [Burkholderia sp. Tr-862]
MARPSKVLYVYKCAACGRRGEQHLDDDSHDGEASVCVFCGAPVALEWDGGVTFETPKTIADEAIERARERK